MNTKNLDLSKSKILVNSENLLSDVNLLAVQLKNKFQGNTNWCSMAIKSENLI